MNVTTQEVRNWLRTKPDCFNDRIVPKRDVLSAYNKWAEKRYGIPCTPIMMGLAMKALFPKIGTKQVKKGSDVYKAYVMPKTRLKLLDDEEYLL